MTIQLQDILILETFFVSSSSEVKSRIVRSLLETTSVEEEAIPPVDLLETSKSLFDLALKNGFRALGAD